MKVQHLTSNLRGKRYGEVLLAYLDERSRIDVYNSFPMNDCPDELWRALDTDAIVAQFGATACVLNGPRYWMMDGIAKIDPFEALVATFGGIEMRRVATLELDAVTERATYTARHVNRGAAWFFYTGTKVFELWSPGGDTYVLQSYCTGVDAELNESKLDGLADRLDLPSGWRFHSRLLEEELVIDTMQGPATVLQDEFQNTYTLL